MKAVSKKFDQFPEHVLNEHNERRKTAGEKFEAKDMVDLLLQLADDPNLDVKLERYGVKAFTQVEGAYLEDAKSLSNWDTFCHSVGCGENGENGDIADYHYHLFLKDIEIMHSLGLKAYRFSISWARILPRGKFGEVNPMGIMFYNKIIDNLILKGIEPFVTIHHFDFPQELEDKYGSWLNHEMQEDFVHLADICFKYFGDRVKYWTTFNEPNLFTDFAYMWGAYPPSRCSKPFGNCRTGNSDVEPLIVMHNMVLAHGKTAKLYYKKYKLEQGGSIGIVVNCLMFVPLTNSKLDVEAAQRAFAFSIGRVLDPLIYGDYPQEMHEYLGNQLPKFSIHEKYILKNSIDFIGINHYSSIYTKDCTNSTCSPTANRAIQGFLDIVAMRDGVLIGESTGIEGFYVVPKGIEEIVNEIKFRYKNKPMFITENGYSSPDLHEKQVNVILNDTKRVKFHQEYLEFLAKSIREGADVRGYFVWSLMDNYEWLSGYNVKFGLYYVDRETQTRIPKLSAIWYKNFLLNKTILSILEHMHK
ncbi:LOW QUALITY PROTEIN: beta-glucosidase 18 [Lactuca sativa]|uniref:LOW QUALITY PROTEIN: beta-glucosidase 18 n=1 Tax=Lactuca sativa TaxID=4236 RepID=UPI0022AF641E|nr:LOW QUALITY PROTEIN: beta-glucosidase 18 [Lactuca sativa]